MVIRKKCIYKKFSSETILEFTRVGKYVIKCRTIQAIQWMKKISTRLLFEGGASKKLIFRWNPFTSYIEIDVFIKFSKYLVSFRPTWPTLFSRGRIFVHGWRKIHHSYLWFGQMELQTGQKQTPASWKSIYLDTSIGFDGLKKQVIA